MGSMVDIDVCLTNGHLNSSSSAFSTAGARKQKYYYLTINKFSIFFKYLV